MSLVFVATAVGVFAVGCTSSDGFDAQTVDISSPRALTPPDTADELLFVVSAAEGRVVLDDDGTGTLTMRDLDDVTWFSDRPARDAGETTMRDALHTYGWNDDGDSLAADAPNATLTAPQLRDAIVLELLTASLDDGRSGSSTGNRSGTATFEVRAVTPSDAVDLDLDGLDLFIDSTTADGPTPTDTTERPDPVAIAQAAGFDAPATLRDHVAGLLAAVGAGPDTDRIVEIAVRVSFLIDGSGRRATVPVLLAPSTAPGPVPDQVARAVEQWLTDNDPSTDELDLEFDVTVRSAGSRTPILVVDDVELPLRAVER